MLSRKSHQLKVATILALVLVGAVLVLSVAGAEPTSTTVHAGEPDPTTVFACVNGSSGEIKIVDAEDDCKKKETGISWPLDVDGEVQADQGFKAGENSTTYADGSITFGAPHNSLDIDAGTLLIDGLNDRVGIGTATPGNTLSVVGGATEFVAFKVEGNTEVTGRFFVDYPGKGVLFKVDPNGESGFWGTKLKINTGILEVDTSLSAPNSPTLYVDGPWNRVGIGTNAPSAKLDIIGNLAIGGAEVIDATGQWVGDPTGLVGPQGTQGDTGADGAPGADGADGADGAPGPSGYEIVTSAWNLAPGTGGIGNTTPGCPSGKKAVGGGISPVNVDGADFWNVMENFQVHATWPNPTGANWMFMWANLTGLTVETEIHTVCITE
tara:strand:+ start:58 stop:1200 length:1143 start_codon:yes stop_codon:yes gene_type:complete